MDNNTQYVSQKLGGDNLGPKLMDGVEIHMQRTRELEEKAHKILNFLIVGKFKPETFLRCLNHITQEIYDDVVQERALSKICGYPLCSQAPTKQFNQRYSIDVRTKLIYETKRLEQFCSIKCYVASNHIKTQIKADFMSANVASKTFNLLSADHKTSYESEITVNQTKPVQVDRKALTTMENPKSKGEVQKTDVVPNSKDVISETQAVKAALKENVEPSHSSQKRAIVKENNGKTNLRFKAANTEKLDPLKTIKTNMMEWVTFDTYKFLYGEDKVAEMVNKERLVEQFKSLTTDKISFDAKTKCSKVVSKLKLQELEYDKSVHPSLLKPLPNYKQLQQETANGMLKLQAWTQGELYDKTLDEESQVVDDENEELHNSLQLQIKRRQIFVKSIKPGLRKVTHALVLPTPNVLENLYPLLNTFNLEAHNIMFEPTVSTITSLMLLQLLSLCDDKLKAKLESNTAMECIRTTYELIPDATTQIVEILEDVKDINVFLKNYLSSSEDTQKCN